MSITTKLAKDLKPGDVFVPQTGLIWRKVLTEPKPIISSPPSLPYGDLLFFDSIFLTSNGRMAGAGNKNNFYPQTPYSTYLYESEHVIITTDFISQVLP